MARPRHESWNSVFGPDPAPADTDQPDRLADTCLSESPGKLRLKLGGLPKKPQDIGSYWNSLGDERSLTFLARAVGLYHRHLSWCLIVTKGSEEGTLKVGLFGRPEKEKRFESVWECLPYWVVRVLSRKAGNPVKWERVGESRFMNGKTPYVAHEIKIKELYETGSVHFSRAKGSILLEVEVNADFPKLRSCELGKRLAEITTSVPEPVKTFTNSLESGKDVDFILVASDGKEVKAHMSVLKRASPELKKLVDKVKCELEGNGEGELARLEIPELGGQALEIFVKFVYAKQENWSAWPREPMSVEVLKQLLKVGAGEKYGVAELKELAVFGLLRNLKAESVDEVFDVFLPYELSSLQQEAVVLMGWCLRENDEPYEGAYAY